MQRKQGPMSSKALGDPGVLLDSRQDRPPPASAEPAGTTVCLSEWPPAPPPRTALPPTVTEAQVGLRQSGFPQGLDEEAGHNRSEVTGSARVSTQRREAARKPAIARLVGTAKAVSMSQRPMPPSKPRSGGSAPGPGQAVSRARDPVKREPAPGRWVPLTGAPWEELLQGCPALRSAGYGRGQPDGTVWLNSSGRKTTTPERKVPPPQHPTHSEQGARTQECAVAQGSSRVVKSASELLEEAMHITGTRPGGEQVPPKERLAEADAPVRDSGSREGLEMLATANALVRDSGSREGLEMLATANALVRDSGSREGLEMLATANALVRDSGSREGLEMLATANALVRDSGSREGLEVLATANALVRDSGSREGLEMLATANALVRDSGSREEEEIIMVPQNEGDDDALSTAEQVTKEPMDSVLRDRCAKTSEEDELPAQLSADPGAGRKTVPQSSYKKEASSQQALCHEDRCLSNLVSRRPALSAVLHMADPVSESDPVAWSQHDITMASALPREVTYADVMVARGSTIVPAQRSVQESRHCGLQSHSFLATWTPKTNVGEYKTIHHLCVTPACQAQPLELQLASQICHSRRKLPAIRFLYQQKAANCHITDQADRRRAPGTLSDWQEAAEFYVERPRMMIQGQLKSLFVMETKMLWNPAPPKFACSPSFIRDKLFPEYQVTHSDLTNEELHGDFQEVHESACDTEQRVSLENVLSRRYKSMEDLTMEEVSPQDSYSSSPCVQVSVKRPVSAPLPAFRPKVELKVTADFSAMAQELEEVPQRRSASALAEEHPPASSLAGQQGVLTRNTKLSKRKKRWRTKRKVPGEHSMTVSMAKKVEKHVQDRLKDPARSLSRSQSLLQLPGGWGPAQDPAKRTQRRRAPSLPLLLDFEHFAAERGGVPATAVPHEWVREVWEAWFDELFPPLGERSTRKDIPGWETLPPGPLETPKALRVEQTSDRIQAVDEVDLSQTLGEALTVAALEAEVATLTQAMGEGGRCSAFDLCRRGAINKKLGHLSLALEDLNLAISHEPFLLDAYWHRHSIHLLRNDPVRALEDLNFITKYNKRHAEAFKSKAEIYRAKGDSAQAIHNYTRAIEFHPEDDETYFRRAKLFEERNEILLAMEDYAKTFTKNPGRTDALLIHSLLHIRGSNWLLALEDLSLLLEQQPHHANARTHRGRVYVKLGKFREAMEDFTLALHLDPDDWRAFYHRGCLLRKSMPELALRDLSTSVLINDSAENLSAFLHRGLLYVELKHWQQAVSDFKAVIKLNRSVAVAHVNLGLIYMLKMGQNQKAIRMFTNALSHEPTYIRAHICRAQVYHRVNELQRALRDVTSAIHMKPDAQNLYIMRGQYLCDMEQFELATFSIHYSAEMNKALGSSPIQQAAVQSFLGNKTKAIVCLVAANDACPSLPFLLLLGKTQMKAHKFAEAVDSFRRALTLLSPKEASLSNGCQAAEVFYLTGLCYVAQAQLMQRDEALFLLALDAFGSALRLRPDYADAHHQRGICRARLKHPKSVQDFNRALSVNPTLFQAYLSRAALFGAQGRYSKAILNCNEAIEIQPSSVRAYLYRGVFKSHMKGYKGAVQDLTTAIKIDSTCSVAYYNRGACHQQLEENELALRDYSIVLLLASRKEIDLKVLINRGLLYLGLNDYHNALQDFKAACQKSSKDSTICHALGVLHHRLGQLQQATEAYTQAMQLNPFYLDAYVGRGNALMDYGHAQANKQAQRDFLSALHLNPLCSSARISLGYNLQVFGRFQRAWNQFTVAADIQPECWAALEGRAVVSLQMGHTYAAFQDLSLALRQNPHADQLHTNRGVVNEFLGDKVNAMRDYQKAISLNPKCALAFFNAGNLYFHNSRFSEACEFYSRASELDPGDESVLLNRAITHTLLRKVPEALRDFSAAQRLSPFSSHVFFNRANLYCSLRKYHSAERELTEALRLQPNDALMYKLRADVRGHLGLTELAISDYKMALELQEATEHEDLKPCAGL